MDKELEKKFKELHEIIKDMPMTFVVDSERGATYFAVKDTVIKDKIALLEDLENSIKHHIILPPDCYDSRELHAWLDGYSECLTVACGLVVDALDALYDLKKEEKDAKLD